MLFYFPKQNFIVAETNDDNSANTTANFRANINNSSLIAHISNLPGFDPSKARIVKHLSLKPNLCDYHTKEHTTLDFNATAAEFLPWRRDKSYQSLSFGTCAKLNLKYIHIKFIKSAFFSVSLTTIGVNEVQLQKKYELLTRTFYSDL